MLKRLVYKSLLFLGVMAFFACTQDDSKNIETISAKKIDESRDRSLDVNVEYSDSAVVKARGFAPVYDKVTPKVGSSYNEMPKGVKIEFLDPFMNVTGTITSDYAQNNETERITIFRNNVVVVNSMMTFKTNELIWDENTGRFTSTYGTILRADGSTASGMEFSAPQDFSTYTVKSATATGFIKDNLVP